MKMRLMFSWLALAGCAHASEPAFTIQPLYQVESGGPQRDLTYGQDGFFYGTTARTAGGRGTVFRLSRSGELEKQEWLDDGVLTAQEKQIIEERFDDLARNPRRSIPWEQARAELLSLTRR